MPFFRAWVAVAMGFLSSSALPADWKRTDRVACTIDGSVCARARLERDETVVERANGTRTPEKLWSVPHWLNVVRVSRDGSALLVESLPFNQIPADAGPDFVVLRLYANGQAVRNLTLGTFLKSHTELELAYRVGAWSQRQGSDEDDVERYLLVTGRYVSIHLLSGRVH